MTISRKLKLAAVIPAVMTLVIGAGLFPYYLSVRTLEEEKKAAIRISDAMSELNDLARTYVLRHEERPRKQFLRKHEDTTKLITATVFEDPRRRQLQERVAKDTEAVKALFLKLVSNYERHHSIRDDALLKESEERLVGQLVIRSREAQKETSRLVDLISHDVVASQRRMYTLALAFMVVAAVPFAMILLGLMRSIAASLERLRQGVDIVGSGDLDHRIGISSEDEIGTLAKAFDRMSEKLRAATVSRDELAAEVAQRKRTETALEAELAERRLAEESARHLASFPHLNPNPIIEVDSSGKVVYFNPASQKILENHAMDPGDVHRFLPENMSGIIGDLQAKNLATVRCEIRLGDRVFGETVHRVPHSGTTRIYALDITERKRAEEELQAEKVGLEFRVAERTAELKASAMRLQEELEKRRMAEESLERQASLLTSVLDSVGDGVVVADRQGRILLLNPEGKRIVRKGTIDTHPDEWEKQYGFFLPDTTTARPTDGIPLVRAIGGESFDDVELFVRYDPKRDGIWISCSGRPLRSSEGVLQGGVVAFRDITTRKQAEKSLQVSMELMEKIFSNIHFSVVYLDAGFNFLRVNQAYADTCGHPPEFFTGKNHFDLYPHEENEAIFRKVVETGEPFHAYARPFVFPDHPERAVTYWDWSLLPLKEPGGKGNSLIFCLIDVTERRKAELELLALNRTLGEVSDTLRGVIQASPLPILLLDPAGNVKIWNPAAERVFGWSRNEVLGRSLPIVPEERKEEFLAILARSQQGESFSNLEVQRVRRDGTRLDVLVSTAPLGDVEGNYVGNIAILVDITDRKRIENALRESEERFRSLVEHSPVGIFIVRNGRVVFRNPEQARLFGPMPENFEFRAFRDVHPEDAAKFGELVESISSGGEPAREIDLRFFPYGNSPEGVDMRWVHARTSPIEYRGEKSVLVIMADITQLKEMEHQFLVREKLATLGHVAAGLAHEIRNPLSGINIHLSALEKLHEDAETLDAERREQAAGIVRQIESASERIESVIKKVMDFVRPSAVQAGLADINLAIGNAIDFTAVTIRKRGVTLDRSRLESLPKCNADSSLIMQVMMNLITNAAQAMGKTQGPKVIGVSSTVRDGRIVICVSDSGPGVPPALRNRIFDPFFTTRKDGYGIGLSFCRRVIEDHKGVLAVGASRWGGAEFRIELPLEPEREAGSA